MGELLYKELAYKVIGAAMEVHRELDPGVPEAAYQAACEIALRQRRIPFIAQKHIQVRYKGTTIADYFSIWSWTIRSMSS